jgi:DNA polymerase-1
MYLFRAYAAIPPTILLPGDKKPIQAVYGLLSTLGKLVKEKKVERIVCVMDDVAADEERIALDPGYKVNRRDFPEDLARQAELSVEALGAAGFAVAQVTGWEADDVIATIARRARADGESVVIVGADKDLLQALEPGDALYDMGKKDRLIPYAEASVVLGVSAPRTPDFLALAGDPVDEIEGVPGIGKKTAALLINALGGVEDIYANLPRVLAVKGLRGAAAIHARLVEHEAEARRALTLATLKTNAPVKPTDFTYRGTTEAGRSVLREKFGFDRLTERLPRGD